MNSWHRWSIVALLVVAGCAMPPTVASSAADPAPAAVPPPLPPGKITTVTVNGKAYGTGKEALAALWQISMANVQGLQPEATPLHGKARIVTPDRDRLRPVVMQMYKGAVGEILEYRIDEYRQNLLAEVAALTRSKAFDSVTSAELNDTVAPDIGKADYLVWYQVRSMSPNNSGPWAGIWLIKTAGSERPMTFGMDPGVPLGTPRYASFVKGARDAVARLGGGTVAAAGPGKPQAGDKDHQLLGSGSGIVIDTQGHVLTNDHVVRSCGEIRIRDAAEASNSATVQARDGTNDLALLKGGHASRDVARLRDSGDLRQGEGVTVIGYPLGDLLGSGVSVVSGSLTKLVGLDDDSRKLQVSAPVQPGNSGGPLLDNGGNVIGVVSGTLNSVGMAAATGFIPQNVNFAIKTTVVRSFLDANHVGYTASTGVTQMTSADVADLGRKFTVRIECRR
jgi:S1-C subfamily serine protease